MGKVTGFKEFSREVEPYRPAKSRVLDFKEIYTDHDEKLLKADLLSQQVFTASGHDTQKSRKLKKKLK